MGRPFLVALALLAAVPALAADPQAECLQNATYDGILASYGKSWTRDDCPSTWHELAYNVIMNEVCTGIAERKADSCANPTKLFDIKEDEQGRPGMGPVAKDKRVRRLCGEEDHEVRNILASVEGPETFKKVCNSGVPGNIPPEKLAAVCEAGAARLNDPKRAADEAAAIQGITDPRWIKHIEHDMDVMHGLLPPEKCAYPDPYKVVFCEASYVFHRVRSGAGAPSECGSNAICRAMTGSGPAVCEPYARAAKEQFCRCAPRKGKPRPSRVS